MVKKTLATLFAITLLSGCYANVDRIIPDTVKEMAVSSDDETIIDVSPSNETSEAPTTNDVETTSTTVETTEVVCITDDTDVKVHFIDVGQGDCTLINSGHFSILIDAGTSDTGTLIQKYLLEQGITKLDMVIATHGDNDHIGSLPIILTKFEIGKLLMGEWSYQTTSEQRVKECIDYNNINVIRSEKGQTYSFGDVTIEVLGPSVMYDSDNNNSIVIRMEHKADSFYFGGDAEKDAEHQLVAEGINHVDCYKVSHHGSSSSTSEELLDALSPQYAVISCGAIDYGYGHPTERTLESLQKKDIQIYRTNFQSTIICTSTGSGLVFNQEPCLDMTPGIYIPTETSETLSYGKYVLNISSMKFHTTDCESVLDIKDKNKQEYEGKREVLIEDGYSPCKRCNP